MKGFSLILLKAILQGRRPSLVLDENLRFRGINTVEMSPAIDEADKIRGDTLNERNR